MRFAVVGGGISGCATALALLNRQHEVTIHESGETLGGVLRELCTAEGRYFQGCQYFNPGSELTDLLQTLDGIELQAFPHRYGSWNDLFGEIVVHHDFAQPVVPGRRESIACGVGPATHAAERLAAYEPQVADALQRWAGRLGPLDSLDAENCTPMQLGRVFYRDAVEAVRRAKANNTAANQRLGLPRSAFEPPLDVQRAALPVGGFDRLFRQLEAGLRARGAHILRRSPVKPVNDADEPAFLVRGEPLAADWVVWCANPTPLLLNLSGERIDAPVLRCFNLIGTLDGTPPAEPVYYQTFGRDHPLLRVFAYHLDGVARLTVEGLDEGWSLDRLVATANRVMHDVGWDARIRHAALVPQSRYTLLTLHDKQCFERFAARAPRLRVVPGGWQHYGRDARLHDILGAIERLESA